MCVYTSFKTWLHISFLGAKRSLGRFIRVEGENINRRAGITVTTAIRSRWLSLTVLVKVNHNDRDVVMEVSPYSSLYLFYVIVPHLPFLCSLSQGCSYQSLCNALHNFENFRKVAKTRAISSVTGKELTALGFLKTISTAASSLSCSQRPSDANIKKQSCGLSFRIWIEGSAVMTGRFNGTGATNCWNNGSLLKSGFFR